VHVLLCCMLLRAQHVQGAVTKGLRLLWQPASCSSLVARQQQRAGAWYQGLLFVRIQHGEHKACPGMQQGWGLRRGVGRRVYGWMGRLGG
jgi:hypothetical protein